MYAQTDQYNRIKASGTHPSTNIQDIIKPASKISGEKKHYEIGGAATTIKEKKTQIFNSYLIPKE